MGMNTFPPVGFLGMGIMGAPMARHLTGAGHPVAEGHGNQDLSSIYLTLAAQKAKG